MSDQSELQTLVEGGDVRTLDLRGGEWTVAPLKVRQIPAFARFIEPAYGALARLFSDEGETIDGILHLLADHGEALIDAVAVATERETDEVEALDLDDFVELAVAVVEVNRDFFVRRLLPAFTAAVGRLTDATEGGSDPAMAGGPSSDDSSPAATAATS